MKIKKVIILLMLPLLLSCFCSYFIYNLKLNNNTDVVEINRITKEVTKNWDNLNIGNYSQFIYPFSVISNDGKILYQSSNNAITSINIAMKNNDIIFDIEKQDVIAGKVIITTDNCSYIKDMKKMLSIFILTFSFIFTLCSGLYYLYLYKNIVKPFKNLEEFAKEIVNGNLDFSLAMNKNNIFGSFTESFDMMREQLMTARHGEFLANQSKRELVAALSHDIKTPVTSIKLTSELLMVMINDEKINNKLNIIYKKAEQINLLITDLFNATLEDLEELSVNPVETYSSAIKSIIYEADCCDKVLMNEIPECLVYIDATRFNQVIANVIYNSYKYADTKINIDFHIKDGYLHIKIQDYGKGIAEEELPLLFNKFYRGKNAASKSGSGLGLYICKKLLEQMEGEIYCSNNEHGFMTLILLKLA